MSGDAGIDYGLIGQSNRNRETGIHYGVISQNSIGEAWFDHSEPDYGEAHCPKCNSEILDSQEIASAKKDYWCKKCKKSFWSEECFPEEPLSFSYEANGYILTSCLDSDIMVIKSPFYTFTKFCSPYVPGAGDLNNYMEGGVKTYCLGHTWFDDDVAPYPVYSVETDALCGEFKE